MKSSGRRLPILLSFTLEVLVQTGVKQLEVVFFLVKQHRAMESPIVTSSTLCTRYVLVVHEARVRRTKHNVVKFDQFSLVPAEGQTKHQSTQMSRSTTASLGLQRRRCDIPGIIWSSGGALEESRDQSKLVLF